MPPRRRTAGRTVGLPAGAGYEAGHGHIHLTPPASGRVQITPNRTPDTTSGHPNPIDQPAGALQGAGIRVRAAGAPEPDAD